MKKNNKCLVTLSETSMICGHKIQYEKKNNIPTRLTRTLISEKKKYTTKKMKKLFIKRIFDFDLLINLL